MTQTVYMALMVFLVPPNKFSGKYKKFCTRIRAQGLSSPSALYPHAQCMFGGFCDDSNSFPTIAQEFYFKSHYRCSYEIDKGFDENEEKSPIDIYIGSEGLTSDEEGRVSGAGYEIYFYIFTSGNGYVTSGKYTYSSSEETGTVYEAGLGYYGQQKEDDIMTDAWLDVTRNGFEYSIPFSCTCRMPLK